MSNLYVDKNKYVDITSVFPDVVGKRFKIEHIKLTEEKVKFEKMRSVFSGSYGETYGLEAGEYVRLVDMDRHECVMSNTWMELRTNQDFVDNAHGDVLIGGLGLGLIVLTIQKKPEVKSITIIEKEKEVIDLVSKYAPFNDKVKIIEGDITTYTFPKGTKFNVIYFDIWNAICGDNWGEMKILHRTFRKYLNKEDEKRWMGSWRSEDCRRLDKQWR